MKKHRRGRVTRKSSRVMALLVALLMIAALIVPMGVKASETADGSASGASEAVAEESVKKEEKKEEAPAKEEKKDSSDSQETSSPAASDKAASDKAASDKAASSESGTSVKEEEKPVTDADKNSSGTESSTQSSSDKSTEESDKSTAESGASGTDENAGGQKSSDADQGDQATEAADSEGKSSGSETAASASSESKEEDSSASGSDAKAQSDADSKAGSETDPTADTDTDSKADSAAGTSAAGGSSEAGTDNSSASGTAGAAGTDSSAAGTSQDAQSTDDAAEESTAATESDETTITFRSKDVTVVADKNAFDTEVTMKVKKVTDPEQLLKMVTALQDEGGSYTVKAYTVSFYDKNGKEVEPKIPVEVTVNTKVTSPSKSKVVHVKDDDKTEVVDADIDRSGASFELDSFSDIGVATEQTVKIPGSSFEIYLGDELTTEYSIDDLPAGPISEDALPEVEGYSYENATVNGQQVEEIGTITDVDGNVYVYYTTKDGNGTIKAEILGDGRIRINLVETETASTYDLEANGAHVHIEAPAGAFDKDTYMVISTVELTQEQQTQVQEQAAEVLGQDASMRIQAVDITFYDKDGNEVQPREAVQVELTTPETVDSDFCVVHLGDTADRVEAQISEDGKIQFDAEEFSVYAVVDDETPTVEEARMTLNFYNGSNLIATVYVKNGDDTDEVLEQIIYDPGAGDLNSGELFKGWILDKAAYTTEDLSSKMTVEDIRTWAKGKASNNEIVEGEEHNFYAMIFKTFSVAFKDENGATIHSEALIFASTEESVDYTINVAYTPKEQDEAFMGWYWQNSDSTVTDPIVAKDGSEQPFVNGTEVTIKDDIVFSVYVPKGNWLSFVENGEGASYTPPQFIKTGETPTEPNNPTRYGYTFGGWYEDAACTGEPFDFTQELTGRTILYAKWTANSEANYTVIVWVENINGDGYDFATMQTLTGNVESTTSNCLSTTTSTDVTFATISGTSSEGGSVNETYDHSWTNDSNVTTFKGFTYKEYTYNNDNKISADGTSVLNVYYDRIEYTLKFYYARSQITGGTPVYERRNIGTANNGNITGITGNQNTYYYTSETGDTRVYWRNGRFRTGTNNYSSSYNGAVWERYQSGTSGGTEEFEVSSNYQAWDAHPGTGGTWSGDSTTAPETTFGSEGSEQRGNYTYYYRTLTAKYGTFIGNDWPKYEQFGLFDNNTYRLGSWAVMRNSNAYQVDGQGTVKGKITIMDEQILGDLTDIDGNYVYANYDRASSQYDWIYHIYFENVSGSGYSLYENVEARSHDSGSNWTYQQHAPAYPGMAYVRRELTTGNQYDRQIDYYYDRLQYPIVFMDGLYVGRNNVHLDDHSANTLKTTDPILYGADVTSYNEGGSNYYVPEKGDADAYDGFNPDGYVFGGWYADAACTVPYSFSTLPLNGVTVYAKWIQKEYRVFLHPNVPTSDTSFNMGGQNTSFRVSDGDRIAGGNQIGATRDEYDLIGWYTDEACTQSFNFDAYYLNDTTVTTPYNQTENTELDKYGNVLSGQEGVNKDRDENRFWITKKLDLYAKWSATLEGSGGINVIYDAVEGEGTGAPMDSLHYLDNTKATAGDASVPNDTDHQQFMHWVVQTWNGSEYVDTDVTVYPGDVFTVLKANSQVLVTEWVNPADENDVQTVVNPSPGTTPPDSTHTKIKTATYTVQLRAEYGDKAAPTPTHIWWFPNNVAAGTSHSATKADNNLKINQSVTIPAVPSRPGYKFLGWAKVPAGDSNSIALTGTDVDHPKGLGVDLDEDDLFLTYHEENGGYYTSVINSETKNVSKVAADEQSPYDDLYAVWDRAYVDIVVTKNVTGNMGDTSKSFTFNAVLTGDEAFEAQASGSAVTLSSDKKTASFSLKGGDSITITGVPVQAVMTITETNADGYETTAQGTKVTNGTLSGKAYSFTVSEENGAVTFTNNKTAIIDTGADLDFLPYFLILAGIAAVGAVLILRRRREV